MTRLYAAWAILTIAVILIGWRREIVRDRNAARARDQRRHPSSRIDHGAVLFAGLTEAELMAAFRERQAQTLLVEAAEEVAGVETVDDVVALWGQS